LSDARWLRTARPTAVGAAAHRIAKRLASVRTDDDEPSPEANSRALRDVVGRCLYGVDVNPMAVELCGSPS
jgi:hypothetical protein